MNTQYIAKELEDAVSRISPSLRITAATDPMLDNTISVQIYDQDALRLVEFILDHVAEPHSANPRQGRLF